MHKLFLSYKRFLFVVLTTLMTAVFTISPSPAQAHLTVSIDPANTFLRTGGSFFTDPRAGDSVPIELLPLGIEGGDIVTLQRVGEYRNGREDRGYTDTITGIQAVFSASNVLLPADQQNRVQDALDAGADFASHQSPDDTGPSNDILEDFQISGIHERARISTKTVQVPLGATLLFVAATDIYWSDNDDPDGDFEVRIMQAGRGSRGH